MVSPGAMATMPTSAAGNKRSTALARGFTLLELLVVVALIAVASAGVGLSLRDSADTALQREAERLAALLETGRAQARASGVSVVWRAQAGQFVFEGLPKTALPQNWLNASTQIPPNTALVLGPEPLVGPQAVALSSRDRPDRMVWVATDGLRPFQVHRQAPGPGQGQGPRP